MPDGYWSTAPDRPPVQYSDYTTTALGVWSLRKYAPEGRREEFEERVRRAMNWFTTAGSPAATEEAAFRLLGLGWAGAQISRTMEPMRDLLKRQRADGGWAQFPTLESDAYATGQVLAALRLGGGLAPATRAYQRGLQYLLDTQREDGSWHVKSRARPFQPVLRERLSSRERPVDLDLRHELGHDSAGADRRAYKDGTARQNCGVTLHTRDKNQYSTSGEPMKHSLLFLMVIGLLAGPACGPDNTVPSEAERGAGFAGACRRRAQFDHGRGESRRFQAPLQRP